MLSKTTQLLLASAAAALLVAGPASALPVTGGISFSDGLSTYGTTNNIVSLLTAIDDDAATPDTAQTCTGSFSGCPSIGAWAHDFTIANGDQVIYTYNGFTFHLTTITFGPAAAPAFFCSVNGCNDGLTFTGEGYVVGNGFDPTLFTIAFTAQGTCNRNTAGDACDGGVTASWSSSISATGRAFQIPEPGVVALLGVGLLALGFSKRRRS